MSETCADCGLPFDGLRPAGYMQASQRYHVGCGDPFGAKARDAEISKLKSQLEDFKEAAERICFFDWSDNDPDAVRAIGALRILIHGSAK